MKSVVKLQVYDCPNALKAEIGKYISDYNKTRYHESLGNVTPDDVYVGLREMFKTNVLGQELSMDSQMCLRLTAGLY